MITLTPDQDAALVAINRWLKEPIRSDNWYFILNGFAGTGKTTLMKYLIESMDKAPICCAPTNKAASVLRAKLDGVNVVTIHSLLYTPMDNMTGRLDAMIAERLNLLNAVPRDAAAIRKIDIRIMTERGRLEKIKVLFKSKTSGESLVGATIIVDESSMVTDRMRFDFEATGARVLFIGDSFQLPPVNAVPWFFRSKPNIRLTQVMRQALDSPIIRLSIQIREGQINSREFNTPECLMTTKDRITYADWLGVDQVITGSNLSRQKVNRFFRHQLARDHNHLPVAGDKLICLKSNLKKDPIWINGIQFLATGDCTWSEGNSYIGLNAEYEGSPMECVEFDPHNCKSHYDETSRPFDPDNSKGVFMCDFAYAITVHKSQGSEWDSVLVADDKMQIKNREFRQKWLYTAATRAKKRLMIIE